MNERPRPATMVEVPEWRRPAFYSIPVVFATVLWLSAAITFVVLHEWLAAVTGFAATATMVLAPRLAMLAYDAGWYGGRARMLLTMADAQRHGMSFDQWLRGEAERDGLAVTDFPVVADDP